MQTPQQASGDAGLIMIVDDDPIVCEFVSMALADQGYRTVTACDGALALTMLEGELPSLILTDAGMPQLDGHEFAARVQQGWGGRVPLVIMSGSEPTNAERRESAVAAYLAKPFDLDDLFNIVHKHARGPEPARSA